MDEDEVGSRNKDVQVDSCRRAARESGDRVRGR